MLVGELQTEFRGEDIRGRLLQPEAAGAPVPPGLTRLPRPGELFVSPALRELLRDARRAGACSRRGCPVAWPVRSARAGCSARASWASTRARATCGPAARSSASTASAIPAPGHPLDPVLALLVVIALVALLIPVGVVVGAAVRTGGEDRDRRLAALRLIGADERMARRIAAGEALVGAAFGLVLGARALRRRPRPGRGHQLPGLQPLRRRRAPDAAARRARRARRARPRRSSSRWSRCGAWSPSRSASSGARGRHARAGSGGGSCCRSSAWPRCCPTTRQNADDVELDAARARHHRAAGRRRRAAAVGRRARRRAASARARSPGSSRSAACSSTPAAPSRAVSGIAVAVAGAIALQMVFTGAQAEYEQETGADPSRAQLYVTRDAPTETADEVVAAPGGRRGRALGRPP